jgi:mechanosensitive ion channel protein 4/5/6/7/8/9/10
LAAGGAAMDQARRQSSLRTQGSGKSSSRPGSGALDPRPAEEVIVRVDGNGNGHAPFSFHGADGGGGGGRAGNATPSTNSTATTPRTASGPRTSETSSPRSPAKVWREGSYEFWNSDGGGGNGADGRPAATEAFSFKNRQPQSPSQVPSPSLSPQQQPAPASAAPERGAVDPPTRLIGNFLRKQAASGGEVALDLDLEMEELGRAAQLREQPSFSSSLERDARVSFREPQKRRSTSSCSSGSDTDDGPKRGGGDDGEVVRCTSSSTAAGAGPLLRAKTRSRLMDPPPQSQPAPAPATAAAPVIDEERKSSIPRTPTKSGQLLSGLMSGKKSGPMGKSGPMDEEEDDPFADEDIPDDFKRGKLDFLTVLQWLGLFLVIAALVCSVTIRILSEKKVLGLHLWKWELLVFVLICGRLVSGWVMRIAVFGFERNFLLRKRVLYFVYGVRSAVQNALWLGLVLASWHFMFDKNVQQDSPVLPYVTKILFCFLVATLIRLVKTLLLKVLASSFHVSTYFDRIQEALFNQYVIETLSGPPLVDENHVLQEVHELQRAGATIPKELRDAVPTKNVSGQRNIQLSGLLPKGEGSKQLSKENGEGISIDMLHKLNQKNVSAWNMKRLMRIVRFGTLTTMDEQIQQATGEGDESATQIRSEYEAKIAAKRIFNNVATPGSK